MQTKIATRQDVETLANTLLNTPWTVDGVEYSLSTLGWTFAWNNRKRSIGLCRYRTKTVEVSTYLFDQNIDKIHLFEDTIRHEIAHAIDVERRGTSSHDYIWKSIAVQVGADPTRTKSGLEDTQSKYTLQCPNCGDTIPRHKRPKRVGACYDCCIKYSGGQFDYKYQFKVIQNR